MLYRIQNKERKRFVTNLCHNKCRRKQMLRTSKEKRMTWSLPHVRMQARRMSAASCHTIYQ